MSFAAARVSQRPSYSCTECSRRKTKCDKQIPCSGCVKRGKASECRIEPYIPRRALSTKNEDGTPLLLAHQPNLTPEAARIAVQQQLDLLKASSSEEARAHVEQIEQLIESAMQPEQRIYVPVAPALPPQPTQTASSSSSTYNNNATLFAPNDHFDIAVSSSAGATSAGPYALPSQPQQQPHQASTSKDFASSRTNGNRYPNSSERGKSVSDEEPSKGEQREEVEASIALEFLALGRNRPFGEKDPVNAFDGSQPAALALGSRAETPSAEFVPPPSVRFGTIAAIEAIAPTQALSLSIVEFSLDWLGWHHGAVHAPTFKYELDMFWAAGSTRYETGSTVWLALYFAILTVGVGNMPSSEARHRGLDASKTPDMARDWFQCVLSLLNMHNWLQNHHVNAVQAIAVLVVSAQEFAQSNLIPTLLSTAIAICQQLGYHRMSSDEQWLESMRNQPADVRARSLVSREVRKRVFWALTVQDWFSIPFRRTYNVQPTQVTTPLPNNVHEEDLLNGELTNSPPSEYTVVSSMLLWIQIARCIQSVFEHLDQNASPSYEFVLKMDKRLQEVIETVPAWMRDDGSEVHPSVQWMRHTFAVSSQHKVLTLHRPFLHRAFHDERYMSSRQRAISASRKILRASEDAVTVPLWTVPYHMVAAGCLIMLDIFQRSAITVSGGGAHRHELDEERREVEHAIRALEKIQDHSRIARRGVILLSNLLAEEQKVASSSEHSQHLQQQQSSGDKKRKFSEDEHGSSSSKRAVISPELDLLNGASGAPAIAAATQMYDPRATSEFLAHLHEWDPLDGALSSTPLTGHDQFQGLKHVEALEALPWEQPASMALYGGGEPTSSSSAPASSAMPPAHHDHHHHHHHQQQQ